MNNAVKLRKDLIARCHRIVIKAGTRLLTDPQAIPQLVDQIARIRSTGRQVIFVSSGAVGTAMKMLKLKKRPSHLSEVQALAAIGQVKLMSLYQAECQKRGFHAAQLLLTADDLRARERHLNLENCIEALLSQNVLPILNENDPVSVDELKFGDNDSLASLMGSMTRADLTVILTTVNGLLKPNEDGSLGDRISVVQGVTKEQHDMASGTDDGNFSIGGMTSKLKAAEILNSAGEALWIADGREERILEKIFNGEEVGTIFIPAEGMKHKMESKKRWINTFSTVKGKVVVDNGAVRALRKTACSLLPAGLVGVKGSFKRGDIVEICALDGKVIAKGKTNFSSSDCRKLVGKQTAEIRNAIGSATEEEIIHRNNLVVL